MSQLLSEGQIGSTGIEGCLFSLFSASQTETRWHNRLRVFLMLLYHSFAVRKGNDQILQESLAPPSKSVWQVHFCMCVSPIRQLQLCYVLFLFFVYIFPCAHVTLCSEQAHWSKYQGIISSFGCGEPSSLVHWKSDSWLNLWNTLHWDKSHSVQGNYWYLWLD